MNVMWMLSIFDQSNHVNETREKKNDTTKICCGVNVSDDGRKKRLWCKHVFGLSTFYHAIPTSTALLRENELLLCPMGMHHQLMHIAYGCAYGFATCAMHTRAMQITVQK